MVAVTVMKLLERLQHELNIRLKETSCPMIGVCTGV